MFEQARVSSMDLLHTVHVPSGAGPFPTILALHGWGANAHDLLGLGRIDLHRRCDAAGHVGKVKTGIYRATGNGPLR